MKHSKKFLFLSLPILILLAGCGREQAKRVDELTFNELRDRTLNALETGRKREAVPYLEQLVMQHTDHQHVATYKLMLADLYFKQHRYDESFELYKHFNELYPSDQRAEYASYRTILSKYRQTLSHHRDSSETEQTLELCKAHLRVPSYLQYRVDVAALETTCTQKMIDKEVHICNFYIRQGHYKSARGRLNYLRETYNTAKADLEPHLLYLEGKLAKNQKKTEDLDKAVATLAENYPDSPYARMAEGLTKSRTFMF